MARHLGLKYLYDEESEEPSPAPETELNSQKLAALPADLRGGLLNAVLELDTARTLDMAAKIAQQDAALGGALKELAENLEFDRLLALLEGYAE